MGGKGSGGYRPGAGRPRKSAAARALDGNAGHRGRVLPHPSAPAAPIVPPKTPVAPIDEAEAPNDLTVDERHVWLELAPQATAQHTLTPSSSLAFRLLCRNLVLEKALRMTDAGGPSHRGVLVLIDRALDAFGLRPRGAVRQESQADVDPMEAKYLGRA